MTSSFGTSASNNSSHPWIAVASGKGGTGKTSIAVSMALAFQNMGRRIQLIDADVEAPNAHHFLDGKLGEIVSEVSVQSMLPEIDINTCTYCGACAEFCAFSALAMAKERVLVFPELCHGCEGCLEICPRGAIRASQQKIGTIIHRDGSISGIDFWQGRLELGQVLTPKLIHRLKQHAAATEAEVTIVDCPPGTACAMLAAVKGADYVLFVTEPTPFGRHDLELALAATERWRQWKAVIINRSEGQDQIIEDLCRARAVPIIARLPASRSIAEAYADGRAMFNADPTLKETFIKLSTSLEALWR